MLKLKEKPLEQSVTFNPMERCDRCIQPVVYKFIKGDKDLVFCNHHSAKYIEPLISSGWQAFKNPDINFD